MKLKLVREIFGETEILGSLYIDEKFFAYTCEDIDRARKVQNSTCIPFGNYKVKCTMSNRFKRLVPLVWNTDSDLSVTNQAGDKWLGIRIHGGNTHLDTEGCILVAHTRTINKAHSVYKTIKNWIFGSKEIDLTAKLGDKETHTLQIVKK